MSLDEQLIDAVKRGDKNEVESLLKKGADVNAKDNYGNTLLLLAAKKGDTEAVKLLIEEKADVNAKNGTGWTPLYFAALDGYTKVVTLLIKKEADVNAKTNDGYTPLHLAAYNGHTEVVTLLINKGADVNAKDKWDNTPLHYAAEKGYTEVVTLLIKKEADVNAKTNGGYTPLHLAAYNGHTEVVTLLIEEKADVNAKNNYGRTPLYMANYNNNVEVIFVFLVYDVNLNDNDKNIIKANPNFKDCLTAFEKIKEKPHLNKLIEENKKRDIKENVKAISEYIDTEAEGQKLIAEFKNIKEDYGSHEQLSFISQCLLNFVERLSQQYLSEYKKDAFRTGALAELLRLVLVSQEQGNFDLNKKMEIQDYGLIEGSNDALNLSITCKSINAEARQHADINFKKCEGKITTLLTQLGEVESLSKNQYVSM